MIDNIDAQLEQGLEIEPAIIDAANQIVIPTFVSALRICIVGRHREDDCFINRLLASFRYHLDL
jgi:hypothetical protein